MSLNNLTYFPEYFLRIILFIKTNKQEKDLKIKMF